MTTPWWHHTLFHINTGISSYLSLGSNLGWGHRHSLPVSFLNSTHSRVLFFFQKPCLFGFEAGTHVYQTGSELSVAEANPRS